MFKVIVKGGIVLDCSVVSLFFTIYIHKGVRIFGTPSNIMQTSTTFNYDFSN